MIVYLFSFFILLLSSIGEIFSSKENKNYKYLFLFIVFYLILHDGLRWQTGTDWDNYFNFFTNCLNPGSNVLSFSYAYVLINQFVRSIVDNYSLFLFIHAIIVYSLLAKGIFQTSTAPFFSFLLYYGMMVPYLGMNRQFIALGFCIFSLPYLLDNKVKHFIFLVIVACLFHTSAIVFFSAYFLRSEIPLKKLLIVFGTTVVLALLGIINKLPLNLLYAIGSDDPLSSINKIQFYAENQFLSTSLVYTVLAIIKRSIWLVFGLLLIKKLNVNSQKVLLSFNLYFVGSIFYILFNNTILQIVVARGLIYFNIFEIFLIAFIVSSFRNVYIRISLMILLTVYSYFTMTKGFDFYKEDLGYDIFRPYKFIFFN